MTVGLLFVSIGVPLIVGGVAKAFPYMSLMGIMLGVYLLMSYVSGDIVIVKYKREHKEIYKQIIPDDVLNRALFWRMPFITAAIITVIVFAIFYIVYKTTGCWPLQ